MKITRRKLLTSAATVPLAQAQTEPRPAARLKIIVAGGHPGDPECGCGGTIARYTALGHEAVLLYLNRGEAYCRGAEPSRCGTVRSEEAAKACRGLRARPVFGAQRDGQSVVDGPRYDEFRRLLDSEKPDIVFAHWPMDRHRDHRAVAMLAMDAWLAGGRRFALYFYEVADDTMMFSPGDFVDISAVEEQRREACYAHASQQPDKWYPAQTALTRRRGLESGFPQAEGFVRQWESRRALLP